MFLYAGSPSETDQGLFSLAETSTTTSLADPLTPPSKTTEALKAELRSVSKELALMKKGWQEEKRQLLGDKAILQDATHRLNAQVREAEERAADRERAGDKASEVGALCLSYEEWSLVCFRNWKKRVGS